MNASLPQDSPSVIRPLAPAFERMKALLFRPFDLARWLAIGFCAWLAGLGGSGGGGGGGFNRGGGGPQSGAAAVHQANEAIDRAVEFTQGNWVWLVPLALGLVCIGLIVWLLLVWLSSRGQFMFLDNVVTGRAEVVRPWHSFRAQAHSLFVFRVLVTAIGLVVTLFLAAAALIPALKMLRREEIDTGLMMAMAPALGAVLLAGLVMAIVAKLTGDFAVPIMRLRTSNCWAAWAEVSGLLGRHFFRMVLYLLFQVVLLVGVAVAVVLLVLVTCCVAGCLLAVPYFGTVLLLPVLVFLRCYSAGYLGQFGTGYDVFQSVEPDVPAPGPTPASGPAGA